MQVKINHIRVRPKAATIYLESSLEIEALVKGLHNFVCAYPITCPEIIRQITDQLEKSK